MSGRCAQPTFTMLAVLLALQAPRAVRLGTVESFGEMPWIYGASHIAVIHTKLGVRTLEVDMGTGKPALRGDMCVLWTQRGGLGDGVLVESLTLEGCVGDQTHGEDKAVHDRERRLETGRPCALQRHHGGGCVARHRLPPWLSSTGPRSVMAELIRLGGAVSTFGLQPWSWTLGGRWCGWCQSHRSALRG